MEGLCRNMKLGKEMEAQPPGRRGLGWGQGEKCWEELLELGEAHPRSLWDLTRACPRIYLS